MMKQEYANRHLARLAHFMAALKNEDFKPSDSENVVVMGKTGAGKSSVISLLLDEDIGVGHGLDSYTKATEEFDFKLPKEYGARPIKLIDTKGVLDTKTSMTDVLKSLVNGLTGRFYHVNTIMLVIECARFTEETQTALTSLCKTFGLNDIERSKRLVVVVTKVEHLREAEQDRIIDSVVTLPFFKKLGVSEEYMRENTIKVFSGQSEGMIPVLAQAYEQLREKSREALLRKLEQKNSPMTISNDFAQKLTNFLTTNIKAVSKMAEVVFEVKIRGLLLDREP